MTCPVFAESFNLALGLWRRW